MDSLETLSKGRADRMADQAKAQTLARLHSIASEAGALAWNIESAGHALRREEPGAEARLSNALAEGALYLALR